jgi:hypothetical protein
MDFYFGDVYPQQTYYTTRNVTTPEVDDQAVLTKNQDATVALQNKNPMGGTRNIWVSLGIVLLIIVLLGGFR